MIRNGTMAQGFRRGEIPDAGAGAAYAKFPALYSIVMELSKARISALATISAAAGFVLALGKITFDIVIPVMGVFLLASGAAALNQYLERAQDALMVRTCLRPLPLRRVAPHRVLMASLAAMTLGSAVLYWGVGASAAYLGIFAAMWYDGVYTYVKKVTPFAVIPGAIVGSIPPIIGWSAGGGAAHAPGLWALALFFFLWQIPHFMLILIIHKDDYERAGFPTLENIIPAEHLRYINFVWIAAASAAGVLLPMCLSVRSGATILIVAAANGWLLWRSIPLMGAQGSDTVFRRVFQGINIYVLLVMSALTIDRIVFPA